MVGVTFNATGEFPPDDYGYGFYNISDVTASPTMPQKYFVAGGTTRLSGSTVETLPKT